jgi:catechol 2,3-dioxygenase-like lactoylglutathione lyase family enzyme
MDNGTTYPRLRSVAIDTLDARALAEFYRQMLGLTYWPGDEPPVDGSSAEDQDWLVLVDAETGARIAFQQVDELPESTWPDGPHHQMLHLDFSVPSKEVLDQQHERVIRLGARLRLDRSDDLEEPLRVYLDPSGHPFCIFVVP